MATADSPPTRFPTTSPTWSPDRLTTHRIRSWTAADGARLTIRPIRATDLQHERAFVEGLSRRTAYLRLLSPRHLSNDEMRRFTDIDYAREMALVAMDDTDRQVGVARFIKHSSDGVADFAIVLADDWQGRGLGSALMRALIDVARQMGVQRLSDFTLSENDGMLALARSLGFHLHREVGDATITHMTMDL